MKLFRKKSENMLNTSLISIVQGFMLGTAEIIPGVSGSTIALLLGIYDDFIELLYQGSEIIKILALIMIGQKSLDDMAKHLNQIRWTFGLSLGVGMIAAILLLSNLITFLLLEYPQYLFAVLFGLIPPTIKIVYDQLKKPTKETILITGVTAVVLITLFMYADQATSVTNPHPLHLFLGGMLAISTMVLPGVSGSFMLLVLGLYNFSVGLISELSSGSISSQNLVSLGFLLAGMGTGFLTTVRLLKVAFEKYRDKLMSFLLGLLLSSWYVLWPFVEVTGIDHDTPVLTRISPFTMGVPAVIILILIIVTAFGTYKLHAWADTQDVHSKKKDDGLDRL